MQGLGLGCRAAGFAVLNARRDAVEHLALAIGAGGCGHQTLLKTAACI